MGTCDPNFERVDGALGMWKKDWRRLIDRCRGGDVAGFCLTDEDLPGAVHLIASVPGPEHLAATTMTADRPLGAWAAGVAAARLRGGRQMALVGPLVAFIDGNDDAATDWRVRVVVGATLGVRVPSLDGPPGAADGRRLLRDLTHPSTLAVPEMMRWVPPVNPETGLMVRLEAEHLADADLALFELVDADDVTLVTVRHRVDALEQLAAEAWVAEQAGTPTPPEELWQRTCHALTLPDHPPETPDDDG